MGVPLTAPRRPPADSSQPRTTSSSAPHDADAPHARTCSCPPSLALRRGRPKEGATMSKFVSAVVISAIALVTLFVAAEGADAAQGPDSVHFALDGHGAVRVPVTLDGTGPFTFLIDTGSSRSSVSETVAARLGAP